MVEINNPPPVGNKINLCQNTSSSQQISSSSSTANSKHGEGGVSLRGHSACNLPMQVGVDMQGNIRRDFPFDTLPTKEKKTLSNTTLVAAATTTRRDVGDTSTESSTDDLHVFGMRAAEKLAESFASIAHEKGKFSEDLFTDSSDQKMFSTDNSTLDSTPTDYVVAGDKETNTVEVPADESTVEVDVTHTEEGDTEVVPADQSTLDVDVTHTEVPADQSTLDVDVMHTEVPANQSTWDVDVTHTEEGDTDAGEENPIDTTSETNTGKVTEGSNTTIGDTTNDADKDEENPRDTTTDTTNGADNTSVPKPVSKPGKKTLHVEKHAHWWVVMVVRWTQKKFTIVVNTNIKGVIEKVAQNFSDYQKSMKLPGVNLRLHPIVKLTHLDQPQPGDQPQPVDKPEKQLVITPQPIPPAVCETQSTQTDVRPTLVDLVNPGVDSDKRVKVYLDKDLVVEQFLINYARAISPSKGKELSEYLNYLLFLLFAAETNCEGQTCISAHS